MASQESLNPFDNLTLPELLQELRLRDARIEEQKIEIASLSSRIMYLENTLQDWIFGKSTVDGTRNTVVSTGSTPTVSTTTYTRIEGTRPRVVFSSTMPVMSCSSPDQVRPMPEPVKVMPNLSNLITLDDSESTSSQSSVSTSEEPQSPVHGGHDLQSLVRLLDKGKCPKPDIYSLESGRSFSRFLASFEVYCENRYSRCNIDLWTPELGRLLEGEMKEVYDAHGGPDQKYRKMKRHLETWHAEAKERISSSRRALYRNARMQSGESLKIYATRLEHLFRMAYPRRELDGKDLKRHLLTTIPAQVGENLEHDLAILKTATGKQNTWGDVLKLLENQDETVRRQQRSSSPSQESKSWAGAVKKHLVMQIQTPSELNRSKSPRHRSPSSLTCHWCKKPGHHYKDCRRRLNLCLRCGAADHHIAKCSEPDPRASLSGRKVQRNLSPGKERETRRGRTWTRSKPEAGKRSSDSSEHSLNGQIPV